MTSRKKVHRSVGLLFLWLLLLMVTIDHGHAQVPELTQASQPADSTPVRAPTADESVPSGGLVQGLPQRAPQPRTLHDFWPFFAGLAVLWLGLVAYVFGFAGSLRRITARMLTAERGGTSK